ncbi:MAG: carbonic anhydrase [Acidobacteriota bacterium]
MLSGKVQLWVSTPDRCRILVLTLMLALAGLMPACKSETAQPANPNTTANTAKPAAPAIPAKATDAKSALDLLIQGNERFANNNMQSRDLSAAKLTELAKGQNPFAIVLACSDSRVSPELIFDQSLGDIFVVRVAGNIMDEAALGSIEYAAEHLKSPLIFVLGHEKCGAVTAATEEKGAPGNIQYLVNEIKPAVKKAKLQGGDLVAKSVDENVRNVVATMAGRSEILTHLLKENKVKLAGGTYSLSTGKVTVVAEITGGEHLEHPGQPADKQEHPGKPAEHPGQPAEKHEHPGKKAS